MKLQTLFLRQNIMRKVLISLIPILIYGIYAYGLRVLGLLLVVTAAGVLTEYAILKFMKGDSPFKIPEAIFVSSVLFTLTLPPAVPYWVAVLGIVFGVLFGKGVFGGFGKNVFNPALVGRCFIYISFPSSMTVSWSQPFGGFPGGLLRYSGGADVITAATPLVGPDALGAVGGARIFFGPMIGSIGEVSAVLILLAAAYLIYTKAASWKIMASGAVAFTVLGSILYFSGQVWANPISSLLMGGFLFGIVFMATDPISAPRNDVSKVLYGVVIGLLTIIMRTFSVFREGTMFAILVANTFAPLIDLKVKKFLAREKVA